MALRVTALYELGRYDNCADQIRTIRSQGLDLRAMARTYPRLGRILTQERQDHNLPAGTLPEGPGRPGSPP